MTSVNHNTRHDTFIQRNRIQRWIGLFVWSSVLLSLFCSCVAIRPIEANGREAAGQAAAATTVKTSEAGTLTLPTTAITSTLPVTGTSTQTGTMGSKAVESKAISVTIPTPSTATITGTSALTTSKVVESKAVTVTIPKVVSTPPVTATATMTSMVTGSTGSKVSAGNLVTLTLPTASPTATSTATAKPTHTARPTATATHTVTPTATVTHTPLPTATNTPKPTATATNTAVPTATATNTPKPTATATNTPKPTATPTNTPKPTATTTNTPVPTATATNTPKPTATATHTPVPTATSTNTPKPTATATHTPVPTATSTNTPVPTATSTNTPKPTATATNTPKPTATATHTPVPTATSTHTPKPTATATHTLVPTATATNTPVPTATASNTPKPTATATATNTPEPTATATNTPVPTATSTATATATATNTPVPTATLTHTPKPTATATSTNTPKPTATATNTPIPQPPNIEQPADGSLVETGTLTVAGNVAANQHVELLVNGEVFGETTANAKGAWQLPVSADEPGVYTLQARLVDPAGKVLAVNKEIRNVIVSIPGQPAQLTVKSASDTLLRGGATEIIFDASGSMWKQIGDQYRIDIARAGLIDLVTNSLVPESPFAMRIFGHIEPRSCLTTLDLPLSPLNPISVTDVINAVFPQDFSKTAIAASLAEVTTDMAEAEGAITVILLTDGEETCGGDPLAEITQLVESNPELRVNIVGFGVEDETLKAQFSQWASTGQGAYFDAADADALGNALKATLQAPVLVYDNQNNLVASGVINGDVLSLEAGEYTLRIESVKGIQEEKILIAGGQLREVEIK